MSAHGERTTACCGAPAAPTLRSNAEEARICALWNTVDTEHARSMMLRLFLDTWGALGARHEWVDKTLRRAQVPSHVTETLVKQYREETGR